MDTSAWPEGVLCLHDRSLPSGLSTLSKKDWLLCRFCSHSEDALASADAHGHVFVHSLAHTDEEIDLQQVLSLSLGHLHGMDTPWSR